MSRVLFSLVLISYVVVFFTTTVASRPLPADATLALVQVLHRHGARSAIVPTNESVICPRGCGELNEEGKDMLVKIGEYLRDRYNNGEGATNYFDTSAYDHRFVFSRSTDLPRTLQSADGLLRGLFPNMTAYYPVVHTVRFLEDVLLLIDALPSYHVPSTVESAKHLTAMIPIVEKLVTPAQAATIGVEASLDEFCAESNGGGKAYVSCVLALQDVAATRNAEGRLSEFPAMEASYDNLSECRRAYNAMLYPYNASDMRDVQRGSLGQVLVQRMLENMDTAVKGKLGELKMMHYSAHDTTMMPFLSTLGHDEMMLPLFGLTIALDLLYANSTGTHYVRAVQALPGQAPSTNHAVTSSVLTLTCIDADGTTYKTAQLDDGCPLEDFIRFVNTTRPMSVSGMCYVQPEILMAMECNNRTAPTPGSLCAWYRTACPAQGCMGAGGVVAAADLSCKMTMAPPNVPTGKLIPKTVAGGIAAGAAIGGAVLGLAIALFIKRRQTQAGYEMLQDRNTGS